MSKPLKTAERPGFPERSLFVIKFLQQVKLIVFCFFQSLCYFSAAPARVESPVWDRMFSGVIDLSLFRKRIFVHGVLHTFITHVSIDLGRVQLFVSENIFQDSDVDFSRTVHKSSGSMSQFMS